MDSEMKVTANILEAVPAAGKTAAMLKDTIKSGKPTIIASISRQLNRQSYDFYVKNGGKNAIIVDSDNRNEFASVSKTIENSIGDGSRVLFITHSALLQFENYDLFKGYQLLIDEVPDMISLEMMRFTYNSYKVLGYCDPVDGEVGVQYNLVLDETKREELTKIAMDGFYKNDDIAEKLLPVYRSLLYGFPVKYRLGDDGISCVYYIEDLTNQNWSVFNGITIACANFAQTFTGYILKHWNKWKFKESPLKSNLLFSDYKNTDRINVHVMVDQNWSRYVADKQIEGKNVFSHVQDHVDGMFPNNDYIYTINNYRSRMGGMQIQYNPHGLNLYSSETNIVALFSYNPQPWQIPILKELAVMQGLDENELVDAFIVSKYLEPIFQLCTRGDMRNFYSTDKINLVVPDQRAAFYLKNNYMSNAKVFAPVVVMPEAEDRVEPSQFKWKNRGVSAVLEMNPSERRAFYYFHKKNGVAAGKLDPNNTKVLMESKNWLTEYRKRKN
jgi:hypothetical protein